MHFVAWIALLLAQVASPSAVDHESRASEPFAVAGVSHAEAADFLKRLQKAVADQDANAVAALTAFPLTVNGKAGPKSRAEFAQHFDSIYTAKVRTAVLAQPVDKLFANWRGLMIGRGEVWISALCDDGPGSGGKNRRIRVVSVNN
jgi:hypothetical protein